MKCNWCNDLGTICVFEEPLILDIIERDGSSVRTRLVPYRPGMDIGDSEVIIIDIMSGNRHMIEL